MRQGRLVIALGAWAVLLGTSGLAPLPGQTPGRSPNPGDARIAELKVQLNNGLRTRLPSEKEFVDLVVAKVNARELPLDLVMGTFAWARRKKPYPFPYFERALRLRAERQGIDL